MQTNHVAVRWFLAGLLAALPPVWVKVLLAAAPSAPVSLQALIEADWVQQDELFNRSPAQGAAGAPAAVTTAEDASGVTLAHTGRVLDRAARLAERLQTEAFAANLADMRGQLAALQSAASPPWEARRELYFNARRLLRKLAFTNPLLDFDRILFVKRHDSGGVFHMCDQYYGCNGVPGGGLFVLEDPFGDEPRVRDLLAGAVVEKGRLAGRRLVDGAFLSPEVSFDGEEILFAFGECRATETYQWGPEISYHIFRVGADGSGLAQLTDGPWNDFDPCYLPNGRIVFVSERRGGYLRCGRHCPVYTM
ncbi:MAG: hypothetical protein GXY25_22995, partial [Pirellulaceae bacterium]|nr:hypothetical protein [Pirellulaceae bacterium]